jgi:hypothetical protein
MVLDGLSGIKAETGVREKSLAVSFRQARITDRRSTNGNHFSRQVSPRGFSRQGSNRLRRGHGEAVSRRALSGNRLCDEYSLGAEGHLLAGGIRVPVSTVRSEEPGLVATFGWSALDVLPLWHVAFGRVAALVSTDLTIGAFALAPQLVVFLCLRLTSRLFHDGLRRPVPKVISAASCPSRARRDACSASYLASSALLLPE